MLVALFLGLLSASGATVVSVDSQPGMVDSGLTYLAGTVLQITATGTVDLANRSGGYFVDADGTIVTPPAPASGAEIWFTTHATTVGVPVAGSSKTPLLADKPNFFGADFGELLAGFTTLANPVSFSDFTFVVVGSGSTFIVPGSGSYYLWLGVNDTHSMNGVSFLRTDNTGSFTVSIAEIPEPGTFVLLGAGMLALSLLRRR